MGILFLIIFVPFVNAISIENQEFALDIPDVVENVKPLPIPINDELNFIVHGDTHAGDDGATATHKELVKRFLEYKPSLIFNTGDVVHGQWGGPDNWDIFHKIAGKVVKSIPYYPTIGNHDDRIGVEYYFDYFPNLPNSQKNGTYYYVEHPDAIFIVLDVDNEFEESNNADFTEQNVWLDQVLTNYSNKTYKFVFFHRPSYTSGFRGACLWARGFDSTFQKHGVDIVFMGHVHAYERFYINGVHYIATGGAGGIPHTLDVYHDYPVATREYSELTYNYVTVSGDDKSVLIEARYPDGKVFDSFSITQGIPYVPNPDESLKAISKDSSRKKSIKLNKLVFYSPSVLKA